MKKFTYMLVNIALVSVIILAGTAAVKTIEDIRHERVERAKTEYEYKYKETVNFSIEDAGRYNEKNVYKISIYDRETGINELTEAWAYKYDNVDNPNQGVKTRIIQGIPVIKEETIKP